MLGKLFRGKRKELDLNSWNAIGRAVVAHDTDEITKFHEGQIEQPSFADDHRSPELAEAVLDAVIKLNDLGRTAEIRALFDPAHTPFIPALEKGGRGLTFCAILGRDEFLVNQGNGFTGTTTWHIHDEKISKVETLAGFAWSRNHKHFLTIRSDGVIAVQDAYGAPPHSTIPPIPGTAFVPEVSSPEILEKFDTPGDFSSYTHLEISDDGKKILLCDDQRGIIILQKSEDNWITQLLFPSALLGVEQDLTAHNRGKHKFTPAFDMLHAALSPDGRYVALGTQDDGHYVIDLENSDRPQIYAKLGYLSEYPHDACFSDESTFVAFNSCHFYNGVTFAAELSAVRGLDIPPYRGHTLQQVLSSYLRVYASGYLPASMTGEEVGAFVLAGSGYVSCVTVKGKLLWEAGFGSSAGGIDICPVTGHMLLASYSGILHLFDPSQQQNIPVLPGYNTPQELRRWLFWDRLRKPVAW